jgi:hypothetical protein
MHSYTCVVRVCNLHTDEFGGAFTIDPSRPTNLDGIFLSVLDKNEKRTPLFQNTVGLQLIWFVPIPSCDFRANIHRTNCIIEPKFICLGPVADSFMI